MTNLIAYRQTDEPIYITPDIAPDNYSGELFKMRTEYEITKIQWEEKGNTYSISSQAGFYCNPIISEKKIACIYINDDNFKTPSNLVIHQEDAGIHKTVTTPLFICPTIINDKLVDLNKPGKFQNFGNVIEIDGKPYPIINIGAPGHHVRWLDCTIVEQRALDIETGLFHPTWVKGPQYW